MPNTIDELLVGLGFDYDPEDIEEFQKDLDGSINLIKKFATVVVAGTAALVGFSAATTSASDRQGKLADQVGISVEQIDALEFALGRTGGESSSLGNNLEQLAIRISEASRGMGSGIEAFGLLGISITDTNGKLKNTDTILMEVSDSLQRFSKAEQIELADKLGLKDSIKLLQEGSAGIRELTDEARALGVTTAEDAKLSAEFQNSLTDIFQITKDFSRTLAASLVPILEDVANTFSEWWKANRAIIKQNMPEIIDKVTKAIKLLTLASLIFIGAKLGSTLISLITLFKVLGARALLTNLAIAALPLLITSLVAAIALLAEDAKTFFEGGESFIGNMLEKYPQWATEITAIASIFATIADLTGMIFDGWSKIFDFFTSGTVVEDFQLVMKQLGKDALAVFAEVKTKIGEFFDELWSDIVNSFADEVITPIMDKVNAVKDFFSNLEFSNPFGDDTETTNTQRVVLNVDDVPMLNDIKVLVEDMPSVQLNVDDIPMLNDIKVLVEDIPSVQLNVDDTPMFDDIKVMVEETPSIQLSVDDMLMLEGLSSNQEITPSNAISNVSNDVTSNATTAKSEVNVGDIKVNVSGGADPVTTGKEIGKQIQAQLEPIFKQASNDLNSAVVL